MMGSARTITAEKDPVRVPGGIVAPERTAWRDSDVVAAGAADGGSVDQFVSSVLRGGGSA